MRESQNLRSPVKIVSIDLGNEIFKICEEINISRSYPETFIPMSVYNFLISFHL